MTTKDLDNYNIETRESYDLRREILSPQEIRNMLEKRIEERSRALKFTQHKSSSRTETLKGQLNEGKSSIINQIYG